MNSASRWLRNLLSIAVLASIVLPARADEYPPFEKVIEGYKQVQPPADDPQSMFTLFTKMDEGQLLIELPKNYASKKYFFGMTVASGQIFAGLQAGDYYVQWRQYNKRLALISPNVGIRS